MENYKFQITNDKQIQNSKNQMFQTVCYLVLAACDLSSEGAI